MSISAVTPDRDFYGYWVHPELPMWEEGTRKAVVDEWFKQQNMVCYLDTLEHGDSATDEMRKRYFDDGEIGVADWIPECPTSNSILLAIYETEDGPVAMFGIPV